ncbi:trehalose synthase [Bradyrhizobium sp. GM2.4]
MNVLSSVDTKKAEAAEIVDELWYKDAIIYQLHVKAFADSNNDGIGDFAGLTEKLPYLQELGVTALWLLPFYPSPGRDDGYDIADYGSVNPDFGTMKDFKRFIQEAQKRGLRVITELVVNHTSDQHNWFKRARRSPAGSSARNWYVWSDTDQKYQGTRIIFTDTEKSNWTWDHEAGAFYWHRFFSHQPDLNFDNPRVVSALIQVMKRWLDAGVDGFRLDAIPYLCEREGTSNENLPETHAIIKRLRHELDSYSKGKLLLAEANQWPEDVQEYFGRGDECHMAYHFPLMPRIYMAIAQEDRFPITDILRQTPDIPASCQWALFLRNHDELTLEMVTDVERDYLWTTYANDPRARINVGIRRRLAPLMDNDRRKIELMNSLLLSFPGTPIIYYGDEIGMGDNIYLGDRNGVRTPMQWSPDRNGGFSRCDPARLYAPLIMDPVYGYESVNVEAQSRSLSSLLSATKRLISVRKSTLAFGRGTMTFIRPANRAVLAYVRQYRDEVILCVANLSRAAQATELDLSPWKDRIPQEMLGRTRFPAIGELPYMVTLGPYGFYWFQLTERDKSEPVDAARSARIRDAGGAGELDLGVAGARARRVRARGAAGIPVAHALVSGAQSQAHQADADLGGAVLRHRRQQALDRVLRGGAGRRHHALRAADADRMGALRPRTLQSQGARRRASGGPRRDAAGRGNRADLHRPVPAQSVAEPGGGRKQSAAGVQGDQPVCRVHHQGARTASARSSSRTAPRWSTTSMSPRSIVSSKPASIPRSRSAPTSPRSPALPIRRHCSAASSWSKTTVAAQSACCTPMSRTRATAGASPRAISTAISTSNGCCHRARCPARPRSKRPICTSLRRSADGSPSCMWLWPLQSPEISRRSPLAPHTSSAGHPSSRHGPSGFSSGWPPAPTACGRWTDR